MTANVLTPVLPETMHAARFYQPGDVRYEEVPVPRPEAGELIVQVGAALTCGTDLKAYRRGHPVLLKNFPAPFGHEFSGIVAAVGEGASGFAPGDRVVAANSAPCMTCYYCQQEQYNLCENLDLLNGAYAGYIRIPERIVRYNTLKVPEHVAFEAAAFTEPLSVCVRGIEACRIQPGMRVAVLGVGAIGQFMVRLAKLEGAHVTAFGRNMLKRELARKFAQTDDVLNLSDFPDAGAIRTHCTPEARGFDVVIEAVGQPHTWELSVELVRRGGLVNLFGGCASGTKVSFETRRLHYDEITLISLFHHTPRHFRRALELIATGDLDPAPLITDTMPMRRVVEALEKVGEGKAMKIALTPEHFSDDL